MLCLYFKVDNKVNGVWNNQPSLLRELTCHMGSHGVTWYLAEVTFPPLPQPIKADSAQLNLMSLHSALVWQQLIVEHKIETATTV